MNINNPKTRWLNLLSHKMLVDSINEAARLIEDSLEADHWISNHPLGDDSKEFCLRCAQKEVLHLNQQIQSGKLIPCALYNKEANGPVIDGGWGSDYDNVPQCRTCHCYLEGNMSYEAIDGIIEHLEHQVSVKNPIINITSHQQAYELSLIVNNSPNDKQKVKIKNLLRLINVCVNHSEAVS